MAKKDILKVVFSVSGKLFQRKVDLDGDMQDDIFNIAKLFDVTIQDLVCVNTYGKLFKEASEGQRFYVINYVANLQAHAKE
jgi:hypothetical protein